MFKGMLWVFGIWGIAKIVGLDTVDMVFGTMIAYSFLAVIVLFPDEFRSMLDGYGRKRLFKWNKDSLLDEESRKELVTSILQMSKARTGALIVIARGSNLEAEINSGDNLGNVVVRSELIKSLFEQGSYYNNGAVIIRDNYMVSANSLLPIVRRDDLVQAGAGQRHLAALGITYEQDCVAIVVSETTGKITLSSRVGKELDYMFALETKEMNIVEGLDEYELGARIDNLLESKETKLDEIDRKRKVQEDKSKTREEKEQEIAERKAKRQQEREKKREIEKRHRETHDNKQRYKKSKKGKKEDEQKSRGFGGYDID